MTEIHLGRAHVRPGEQPAGLGQRSDLGAEPGHQHRLARAVRRISAHARLGPEARDRAQLDYLRTTHERFACHALSDQPSAAS
jgi:hypothetical protein